MDKYSGFLICSDYDNTLTYGGVLPQKNIDTIKEYRQKGGKFVVVTGRTIETALFFNKELLEDGYLITNNGNVLYDVNKQKIIKVITMERDCIGIIFQILEKWSKNVKKVGVYYPQKAVYTRDYNNFDIQDKDNITKITFDCDTEENTLEIMKETKNKFGNKYLYSRSFSTYFEVCSSVGGKGTMATELKKILKINRLICVGDFENDIDMLKVADVAYAPSNATESIKKIAKKIFKNSENGIFEELIKEL